MLDIAIDSKLRGIDVVSLRLEDVCHGEQIIARASVRQRKTKRPVTLEISPATRKSLTAWIRVARLRKGDYLFPSRINKQGHLSTRQYARIVKFWVKLIGEDPSRYGTHSLRRTKVSIMYRQNHNLKAAQTLLGHSKIENTAKYLGVELDEALGLSERRDPEWGLPSVPLRNPATSARLWTVPPPMEPLQKRSQPLLQIAAVLLHADSVHSRGLPALQLLERPQQHLPVQVAEQALANKLARIVWAVWSRQQTYLEVPKAA